MTSCDDADRLIARGNAMVRAGRVAAALGCFRTALALQPDRFEAHANLGSALLLARRFGEAEFHLRRALSARPDQAPLNLALARACLAQRRTADAEAAYRRALEAAPSDVEALTELGTVLRHRGRYDEAKACYTRALALRPACVPAAYGSGLCLRECGRIDEAIACFERVVTSRPDHIDAQYRLAVLAPDAAPDNRLAQMEAMQPRVAGLAAPQQIRYWFTVGRLRETAREYDGAFAAYAEGNRLQWRKLGLAESYPSREARDIALIRRIHHTFNRERLRRASGTPSTGDRAPIFIVGMPRSGTSLVEQILAAHPAVSSGGELRILPALLDETFASGRSVADSAYPGGVVNASCERLRQVGDAYVERVARQTGVVAGRVTDKLPGNFLHAGTIALVLPDAQIIQVLRDPRDVCVSCFANLFARANLAWSYDLGALARYCVRCRALMRHWQALIPAGRLTTVRYEDLVADPAHEVGRLLDYLDLPWDDRCLAFHRQRRAVHTVSAGQVRRPVYAGSVGRWRRFESHLGPLLDALGSEADAAAPDALR